MEDITYYQSLVHDIDERLELTEDENEIEKLLDKQELYLNKISQIRNAFVNSN